MSKYTLSPEKLVKISRFLSYILRHHPESIGLSLDENGWVEVRQLLHNANMHGKNLTVLDIKEIVARNDKKRFELSNDGMRIRARQGHSVPVDVGLSPIEPPVLLYHGTANRFLSSIKKEGLVKKGRLYVHLSSDEKTACKVGKRHGKPLVITIDALKMHHNGYEFFLSSNGVWLTEHVPPEFLIF